MKSLFGGVPAINGVFAPLEASPWAEPGSRGYRLHCFIVHGTSTSLYYCRRKKKKTLSAPWSAIKAYVHGLPMPERSEERGRLRASLPPCLGTLLSASLLKKETEGAIK